MTPFNPEAVEEIRMGESHFPNPEHSGTEGQSERPVKTGED